MKTRKLGPDGPEVSAIGLGGMWLSIRDRPSEDDAIRTIHAALDAGVTLIDTADVYCQDDTDLGHNERLIAKAIKGRREKVVVATKGGMKRPGGAWVRAARPPHLMDACEASLKALGVETIDLYQLHAPDPEAQFMDSVGALKKLQDQGKIRFIGLSNVGVAALDYALQIAAVQSVQNRWNPTHRVVEDEGMLKYTAKRGIALLPYSPFGGAQGATSLGSLGKLGEEAKKRGMSPHKLVLAWLLAKGPNVIPIPGARRVDSIKDSATAVDVTLSDADVAAIEASFTAS